MPTAHTRRRSQRMGCRPAVFSAATAVVMAAGALALGSLAAGAAGTDAGPALITNFPTDASTPQNNLNSGGSQTEFTFKLPAGAACSGDTADKNFHIFSYIADATAYPDPGALAYTPDGPIPVGAGVVYTLYQTTGSPYVNKTAAPISGFVQNLPRFDFNLYSIDGRATSTAPDGTFTLPAGTYNVGIACAKPDGTGDKYWNTKLVFTADAGDPNGATWTVPSQGTDPTTTSSSSSSSSTPTSTGPDATPPSVTVNQASGQPDPTNTLPVHFTATFSEAVAAPSEATRPSLEVTATGGAEGRLGAAVLRATDSTHWDIAIDVSGLTSVGAFTAALKAGATTDPAGNRSLASTSTDNSITFDPATTTSTTAPTNGDGSNANLSDGSGSGDTGSTGAGGASPAGSLAKTGRSLAIRVLAAMVLVYIGFVVVLAGRRRRFRRLTEGQVS